MTKQVKVSKLNLVAQEDVHKVKINLSSKSNVAIGQVFFRWAINIGKMIIVGTELVALSALFYRFIIDRQIIDLHDAIKREESIVKIQENRETLYRNIQERVNRIDLFTKDNNSKMKLMNLVLSGIKSNKFSAQKFSLQENKISIRGETSTIFLLNDFINELKQLDYVTSITLSNVDSSNNKIKFVLNIDFKGEPNAKL